jgi:hypothetical protein
MNVRVFANVEPPSTFRLDGLEPLDQVHPRLATADRWQRFGGESREAYDQVPFLPKDFSPSMIQLG